MFRLFKSRFPAPERNRTTCMRVTIPSRASKEPADCAAGLSITHDAWVDAETLKRRIMHAAANCRRTGESLTPDTLAKRIRAENPVWRVHILPCPEPSALFMSL